MRLTEATERAERWLPVSLHEGVALALLLAAGLGLRGYRMAGSTLDQFDEAVYAVSASHVAGTVPAFGLYPRQEMFSPPLYFGLAGSSARFFGAAPDQVLLALSILFGTLTILAVWWLGRAGFGIGAGISAAAIVALNPFHIAFSRSALTDVTFTLLLLCALGALIVAIERSSIRWAVLGGLLTGLAWNTKYHGWFALLITGAALVPHGWTLYRQRVRWRHVMIPWLVAAATAFLCYLPWLLYVRTRGMGYEAMTRHYRGMMRPGQWLYDFGRYAQMLQYLEHPVGRFALVLAAVLAIVITTRGQVNTRRTALLVGGIALAALVLGSAATTLLITLAVMPFLLKRPVPFRVWVLLGTIGLWLVSAPLYRPYARLILPFAIATCIGAGAGLARAARWAQREHVGVTERPRWAWVGMLLIVAASLSFVVPTPARIWPRERGLRAVADAMAQMIPRGSRVVTVLDPAAGYYLQRSGQATFQPAEDFTVLDTMSTTTYVISGVYVRRSEKLRNQIAERAARLRPIKSFGYTPYDVRLLDDMNPGRARQYRARPDTTFDLRLFRYAP